MRQLIRFPYAETGASVGGIIRPVQYCGLPGTCIWLGRIDGASVDSRTGAAVGATVGAIVGGIIRPVQYCGLPGTCIWLGRIDGASVDSRTGAAVGATVGAIVGDRKSVV